MKQLLTHSRMNSFKRCRRRHWWEYEIGLRKDTDARALRMGSAGHAGLDALKHGKELYQALEDVADFYATVPEGVEPYDWEIERETVECLVTGYQWRWANEVMPVMVSEAPFRLPLTNPDTGAPSTIWKLAGKVDGVVEIGNRLAVLEHKFISDDLALDGDYWRRLQLDAQISLYVWAARKQGWECHGVLYDVVRKPTIRPSAVPILDADGLKIVLDEAGNRVYNKPKKKADTIGPPRQTGDTALGYTLQTRPMSPEEWGDKLLGDIKERPEWYYARVEIARLDSDLDEMRDEVWDIQKTLRDTQAKGRWYKTVSRDTCPFCPFFGLCTSRFDPSTGEIPEGFIKVDSVHPELEGFDQ